jgi:hypothetical protein
MMLLHLDLQFIFFLQILFNLRQSVLVLLVLQGLKLILFSQAFGDQGLLQVFGLILA